MGLLDGWRLCPRCGHELEKRELGHLGCPGCGSEYYANSAPAVQGVLERNGRVLLAKRAIEPRLGYWDLPGGFLEEGEEPLDGLRREFREETGLDVEPVEWLGVFLDPYNRYFVLGLTWSSAPTGAARRGRRRGAALVRAPTSCRRRWPFASQERVLRRGRPRRGVEPDVGHEAYVHEDGDLSERMDERAVPRDRGRPRGGLGGRDGGDGVAAIEEYLAKHLAFLVYLEQPPRGRRRRSNGDASPFQSNPGRRFGGLRLRETERALERALRHRADGGGLRLAVLEQHHHRDRRDAVALREALLAVDVDLDDLDVVLVGDPVEHRGDGVARAAPLGPEVDDHLAFALEDLLVEGRLGCFYGHGGSFPVLYVGDGSTARGTSGRRRAKPIHTIEGMFTPLPSEPDSNTLELEILDRWEREGTFEQLRAKNRGNEKWSFIDGPVTANKKLGVHTAWGRTLKDVFQRYKALRGFDQRYQNGFDCQGLWIEVGVESQLGFNSKREIEEYGLEEFAARCRDVVVRSAEELTRGSIRLGQWMDWGNDYFTFSDTNIEYIWRFLKIVHERGWLYLGHRSTEWCPRCGTSLSQHELTQGDVYREKSDPSLYVRFPLLDRPGRVGRHLDDDAVDAAGQRRRGRPSRGRVRAARERRVGRRRPLPGRPLRAARAQGRSSSGCGTRARSTPSLRAPASSTGSCRGTRSRSRRARASCTSRPAAAARTSISGARSGCRC